MSFIQACIALLAMTLIFAEGRKWQDVVDRSIYVQPQLDIERYQLKIELDPFFRIEDQIGDIGPTTAPVSSTWVAASSPAPTDSPTAVPSDSPSLTPTGPTSSPTFRYQNIEGNGGCHEGASLYRVNMYDSWGDGWDPATKVTISGLHDEDTTKVTGNVLTKTHITQSGETKVSISETIELTSDHPFGTHVTEEKIYVDPLGVLLEGTLHTGSHGDAYVCLVPKRCYQAVANGGDYLDEVSWNIEEALGEALNETVNPLIQGGAPLNCTFSIPDENGEYYCTPSCSKVVVPENQIDPSLAAQITIPKPLEESPSFVDLTARSHNATQGKRNADALISALRSGQ